MRELSESLSNGSGNSNHFKDKTVLITGGAGSLGSSLVKGLLKFDVKTIRVLDLDEYGLSKLRRRLNDSRLRFLLGDVADRERLELAMRDVDVIYHCAAIKDIDIASYNPAQCIRCNVDGTLNLVEVALITKPKHFFFISSDKSVNATTLYGVTKALGEKVTLWANNIQDDTKFAVLRLCNIEKTRGSVYEIWWEQKTLGEPLTVTHEGMRRYIMSIDEAVKFIIKASELANGGEIMVPQASEKKILDLAKEIDLNLKIIGRRKGEKIHEDLMTSEERQRAKWNDEYEMWVITDEKENSAML